MTLPAINNAHGPLATSGDHVGDSDASRDAYCSPVLADHTRSRRVHGAGPWRNGDPFARQCRYGWRDSDPCRRRTDLSPVWLVVMVADYTRGCWPRQVREV